MTALPMIILIGKTAAGKDSVARELAKILESDVICGITTRPRRPKETDGVDHWFVSRKDFDKAVASDNLSGYYEVEVFDNNGNPDIWRYGIPKTELRDGRILVSNPDSLESILRDHSNSVVLCIEAGVEERRERYRRRNPYASPLELERRIIEEESAFARAYSKGLVDGVIDNTGPVTDTVETIVDYLEQL